MPRKKKTSGRAIATVNPSTNLPALPERFAIGGTEVRPVQLFTNPHRHPGGPGPWEEEPDKLAWIHAKTGKHCILLRQPSGAWSGFVGIDPDHPLWGFRFDAIPASCDLRVHGHIDYGQECQDEEQPEISVCHILDAAIRQRSHRAPGPDDRHPDKWWFGFTADQAGDLIPNHTNRLEPEEGAVYRDIGFMYHEVTRLACQLDALEAPGANLSSTKSIPGSARSIGKKGGSDVQG